MKDAREKAIKMVHEKALTFCEGFFVTGFAMISNRHSSGHMPNGTGLQFTVEFGGRAEQALVDVEGIGIATGRRAKSVGEGDQFRRFTDAYRIADAPQDGGGIGAKQIIADEYDVITETGEDMRVGRAPIREPKIRGMRGF